MSSLTSKKMKWLKNQAELYPQKQFLNNFTFAQINQEVSKMAEHLAPLIGNQSRVALLSENSVEMAVVLFALLGLSKEVLLLNTHLTEYELADQLTELKIGTVFTSDLLTEKITDSISFSDILTTKAEPVILSVNFPDENIAVIMNTSATTGKFKSVPITWGMISNHVKASQETLGAYENDNWLIILPMFHVSGLSIIMRSLYNATSATIVDKFDEDQVLKMINSGKVNMISLVPTMLSRIADSLSDNRLRLILLGGEFIPQPLINKCHKMGLPIYKTYGMTESFSQSVTFNILDFPEKLNSVGRPLPSVEIEIRQADLAGVGEIWLKSPMLMTAYLEKKPYGNAFETGDIGYLDADGFLYLLNRRKDIIISGGENIYPKEIEDLVYSLSEIKECAVIAKSDNKWGQVPILFVSGQISKEKLENFLTEKLAKYKRPKAITFMDELPKNASGKILRKELKG